MSSLKPRVRFRVVRPRAPCERAADELTVEALYCGQLVVRRDGDRLVATTLPPWPREDLRAEAPV